ncbi:sulfate adenylyltransferase subunit 1 [Candidatus Lucifugimonas marina]|uniref:sulfate adenylyltransferase n=1 Tax=Candidatus Lucifugimonas marina TaxID=3038979 RepID=A0AAJ5ZCS4_9CHLR|nr:sulfate adenylyltransferase [SAR202 cluster bacterium JH639]WFG34927.1 sulfate adenylyltransferase [SAR202 cluster bacterium JH545]WFG38878.1 sulfate adenylyltransferase [SAR202 cluster bacterium JH1073]
MELLRIATAGSVDDGKSTLIGRLLFDSKAIYDDVLDSAEQHSRRQSSEYFNLALLTDGLKAEREQGITIDVAYRYFSTPKRKFILADTPGHVQYTRNMVTGASTADVALIIVDARHGVVEQSRRHAVIGALLGIRHVVVCVNKMDLVDFKEEAFRPIQDDLHALLEELEIESHHFIPISALEGDNVVEKSDRMPWYEDGPLLPHLENLELSDLTQDAPFRFPVQYVIRPLSNQYHDYRGYAGTIASGSVEVGQEIAVMPSGATTTVTHIESPDGEVTSAGEAEAVTIRIADNLDISRGALLSSASERPTSDNTLDATVCWMGERSSLRSGAMLRIKHATHTARAMVNELQCKIDINHVSVTEASEELKLNEIGQVTLRTSEPLVFDQYASSRGTGSFILIDESTNETVGAGMIGRPPYLGEIGS